MINCRLFIIAISIGIQTKSSWNRCQFNEYRKCSETKGETRSNSPIFQTYSDSDGQLYNYNYSQRAWNGLTKRAEDIQNGIVPPRKGRRNNGPSNSVENLMDNYKTTTHYITPQTDFIDLFDQYFPQENPTGFCLSGLHTCGNLASSCLKIFTENKDIDVLCNVGCCYHLLGEEYCVDEFFDNRKVREMTTECGFPMSNYLKSLVSSYYLDYIHCVP